MVGTYIQKKAGTHWLGTMPPGLNMPPKTANYNYVRVHGARGYRGSLNEDELKEIRTAVKNQTTRQSFVMFNNTFFDSRTNYCTVDGNKVKYAAVCNGVEFIVQKFIE